MRDLSKGRRGRTGTLSRGLLIALLGLGLVAAPAVGQETPGGGQPPQAASQYNGLPSENMALALSAIGTIAAVASMFVWLGGYGNILAWSALPSLGFMYGGCWGRGLLTTGLRLGATFLVLGYAFNHDEDNLEGLRFAYLGGMALSAIIDIATVKKAVHKRNEARLARRGLKLAVAPFALPKGGGIQVRMSF
jgi:hypothetical protein